MFHLLGGLSTLADENLNHSQPKLQGLFSLLLYNGYFFSLNNFLICTFIHSNKYLVKDLRKLLCKSLESFLTL